MPRTTFAWSHRDCGSRARNVTGVPWPIAVGVTPAATPAGPSPSCSTMSGMPPGHVDEAGSSLRVASTRRLQLVEAERVDEPLHAGSQLVLAVAGLVEHPQQRLDRRQQVLAWREVLERERRMRVGAETAGDEHAEARLDLAVVVRARRRDHADVVEHRLAAVGLRSRRS